MDSHIKGPAVNGHGAMAGCRGLQTKFGVTGSGAGNRRVLLKTTGASATNPLLVQLLQVQKTAFNGTAPDVIITSVNVDGTGGTTTETNIAGIVANGSPKPILIYQDKIYYVQYQVATGAPTTGEIWSLAWVNGLGPAV